MLTILSEHRCFGGVQAFYRHDSTSTGLPMQFSVFHPPLEKRQQVPVLFYLAGLTCTEETFMIKGDTQHCAAYCGVVRVAPGAGPRGAGGAGAGQEGEGGGGAGGY